MKSKKGYITIFVGKELKNYFDKFEINSSEVKYFEKVDNVIEYIKEKCLCLEEVVLFTYSKDTTECLKTIQKFNDFFEYFFIIAPTICVVDSFEKISDFSLIAKKYDYIMDLSTLYKEIESISTFVYLKKREELERKKYELINQAVVLDLYEEFIESGKKDVPAFYYGVDHDGILKVVDDRILKILGFSRDEIIGKHFSELIANGELEKVSKAFKERRTGERGARDILLRLKRKDGGYTEFVVDSQGVHIPTVKEKPQKEPNRLYIGTFGKIKEIREDKKEADINFFNVTNEPVFIYSIEEHKLLLNNGSEKFLGYNQDEVINKDPSFFEEKEYSYFLKALEDLKAKDHISYTTVIVKKSGEFVNCDVTIDQVKIDGKRYLIGIYKDITDFINFINKADGLIRLTSLMVNSKSEEDLIKMASQEIINILDVIYFGIALWDKSKGDFNKIYLNDRSMGQFIDKTVKKSFNNYFKVMAKSINENVVKYFEINKEVLKPFGEKDESIKVGSFISMPLSVNGRKLGCMFVVTDFFHSYTLKDIRMLELSSHVLSSGIYRYELEIRLKKNLDTLEKRVKERTKELEEFVYTVSHDLKSPLYAAKSFAEIIGEQLGDRFKSEEDNYILRRIGENVETAIKMIDDLLSLSRVGTTEMKIEKIKLKDIVDEYILQFKAVDKSDIKLMINLDKNIVPIYGDKGRILQLFTNLFDNSIKYRKSNEVIINVSCKRLDGKVRITIKDNGIGIDEDEIDKIFNVFYRGRVARDKNIEGSGCGLSIVKKIVEMHNGSIKAESKTGEGTEFIIELPLEDRQ